MTLLSFFVLHRINLSSFLHLLYFFFNVTIFSFHPISMMSFILYSSIYFSTLLYSSLFTAFPLLHRISYSSSFCHTPLTFFHYFSVSHTDILPRIRKKYPEISIVEFTQRQGDTVFIPGTEQINSTLLYSS